jgi:mevalonate kinase
MIEHLPEIIVVISTLSGLLGLGAWMVSQLNSVRNKSNEDVDNLYTRINGVKEVLEKRIEKTDAKVISADQKLAVIQETLHGLSVQIGAFAEISKGMLDKVVDNSKQIGNVQARCEAIQSSKKQQ